MYLEVRLVMVVLLAVKLIVKLLAIRLLLGVSLFAQWLVLVVLLAVQLVLLALGAEHLDGAGLLTAVLIQRHLMKVSQNTGSPCERRNL